MNLRFTKFFDVKSPQGLDQNEKEKDLQYQSIGVDLYFPRMSGVFLHELIKANCKFYNIGGLIINVDTEDAKHEFLIDVPENFVDDKELKNQLTGLSRISRVLIKNVISERPILAYYHEQHTGKKSYHIHSAITIPCGIGVDIPEDYFVDLRSKSGNFSNYHMEITGLIDENYTRGMGAQILPIGNACANITEDQKFVQIVMIKANKIHNFEELSLEDWENDAIVKAKMSGRKAGFGSTGTH